MQLDQLLTWRKAAGIAVVAAVLGLGTWQSLGQNAATRPADSADESGGFQATDTGLRYKITQPAGEPMTAQDGDVLMVHYTLRLEDGKVIETSLKPKVRGRVSRVEPYVLTLGSGEVIPGWEQGIRGMKVGEKRTIIVPPNLAYGETGAGGIIPPNATLIFDLQLVGDYRPDPATTRPADDAAAQDAVTP